LFLIAATSAMLAIDYWEFYYSRKFKTMLITLDLMLLSFSIETLLQRIISVDYKTYTVISFVLVTLIVVNFAVSRETFDDVMKISILKMNNQEENAMATIWVELKILSETNDVFYLELVLETLKTNGSDENFKTQL
jgi:hypothetical protein